MSEAAEGTSVPVIIAVAGNIASTKTSVLRRLRKELRLEFPDTEVDLLEEPIHEWNHKENGRTLSDLEASYVLPYGCSFPFQVKVSNWQDRMAREIGRKERDPEESFAVNFGEKDCHLLTQRGEVSQARPRIVLIERTTEDGAMVFVPLKCAEGNFSGMAVEAFHEMVQNGYGIVPDLVVYLQSTPEDCFRRKQRRAREGEGGVNIEFLARLDKRYQVLREKYRREVPDNILELSPEDHDSRDGVKEEKRKLSQRVVQFLREKPRLLSYRTGFSSPSWDASPYDLKDASKQEEEEVVERKKLCNCREGEEVSL